MSKIVLRLFTASCLSVLAASCGLLPAPPVALGEMRFTAPDAEALLNAEIDRIKAAHAAQLPPALAARFEAELRTNAKTASRNFLRENVLLNNAGAFSAPGDDRVNLLSSMELTGKLRLAQPVVETTVLNVYVRPDAAGCAGAASFAVALPQPVGGVHTHTADLAPHGLSACPTHGGGLAQLGSITVQKGQQSAEISLDALPMRGMYVSGSGHFGFNVTTGELPAGEVTLGDLVLRSRI